MQAGALAGFGRRPSKQRKVIALPHGFSTPLNSPGVWGPHLATASGACTAGAWVDILTIRGAGALRLAAVTNANASAKTMELRIVRDGVKLCEPAVAAPYGNTYSYLAVGQVVSGTTQSFLDQEILFEKSLRVQYRSSVTETDGATIRLRYDIRK